MPSSHPITISPRQCALKHQLMQHVIRKGNTKLEQPNFNAFFYLVKVHGRVKVIHVLGSSIVGGGLLTSTSAFENFGSARSRRLSFVLCFINSQILSLYASFFSSSFESFGNPKVRNRLYDACIGTIINRTTKNALDREFVHKR